MFGIRYAKFSPSYYVLHFSNGRVRREGAGLSFYYFSPSSSIVLVPMASVGVPFAFTENTADFQTVTVQGQLTYRVLDHKKLARMLDFTVGPNGKYLTDDFQKLPERLINEIQPLVRAELQRGPLRQALVSAEAVAVAVLANLKTVPAVVELGLEPMGLNIQSIRPTPEIATALETEAREDLQKNADLAIYARRKAAVEQERIIKESELQTELAVEARKREIREKQMATEIAIEQQRADLTEQRLQNERKEADGRAYAIEAMLKPLQGADPRTLLMLSAQGGDAKGMIALAFQEMAANAGKIGELHISPELLNSLLTPNRK
jgi:hypothetical protein